jgi:hypothetical protein
MSYSVFPTVFFEECMSGHLQAAARPDAITYVKTSSGEQVPEAAVDRKTSLTSPARNWMINQETTVFFDRNTS